MSKKTVFDMSEKEIINMRDNWLKGERILFKKWNGFFIPAQCVICRKTFDPGNFVYLIDRKDNNSLACDDCVKKVNKFKKTVWSNRPPKGYKKKSLSHLLKTDENGISF